MFEDNNLLKIQEKEISIYTAESKTLPHNDVNILSARETKKIRKTEKTAHAQTERGIGSGNVARKY